MRPIRSLAVLLMLLLVGAGCGGDDGEDAIDAGGTTTTTGAGGADEPDADASTVVLEAGALIVDLDQRLTFGESTEDEVVEVLAVALGEPLEEGELTDCGEGPLRFVNFPSLSAYFAEGGFAGWRVAPTPTMVLTTVEGIALGSTRAELEEAYPDAVIEESSLGVEATIGSGDGPFLSALLSGDGPDATVEELWSGSLCIAR